MLVQFHRRYGLPCNLTETASPSPPRAGPRAVPDERRIDYLQTLAAAHRPGRGADIRGFPCR